MLKNTAGQKVGCQMVSATDGSAFTGAVTVYVTGDAGVQAAGSVGSGACTHEGEGYHTYAPAQAETNYDLIAFTFKGTGAIPSTVQVYPVAGDAFTRLGAPAGASVSADIAAVKVDTAAILDDTGTSGVVVGAASVRTAVGLASANLDTQLSTIDTVVDSILVDTGTTLQAELDGIQADTEDIQTRLPAALVGGRIDATVDATGMEAGAIDAILDDTIGDGTLTLRQALRVLIAGMAGKLSGAATTTVTIRNAADSANVIVATVDADGNRTAVTITP